MKRILLLSDKNSYIDDDILKYVKQADEVWHAGDIGDLKVTDTIKALKPLKAVYGNIDSTQARLEFPEINRFMCEEVDVCMIHIGGYPGKYVPKVKTLLQQHPPKLFTCGHSRILKDLPDRHLNLLPMDRGAAGVHGFHQVRTALRVSIDGSKIDHLEVIEFKK